MSIVAFDFDGTMVKHRFPLVGETLPLAINTLKELQKCGHQLMLYTMRSNSNLKEAIDYLNSQGLDNFWINENPEQHSWTSSKKQYAHIYIDDAALGCPSIIDENNRDKVNWINVINLLINKKYLDPDSIRRININEYGIKYRFKFFKYGSPWLEYSSIGEIYTACMKYLNVGVNSDFSLQTSNKKSHIKQNIKEIIYTEADLHGLTDHIVGYVKEVKNGK